VEALIAVAEYALWWYARDRELKGLAALPPPVLADAAVQKAYWQASGQSVGYAAVGDWQHFVVVGTGWPLVPNAYGQDLSYMGEQPSPVYVALTKAVQGKVPISGLVVQATRDLNNMLDASVHPSSTSTAGSGGKV